MNRNVGLGSEVGHEELVKCCEEGMLENRRGDLFQFL